MACEIQRFEIGGKAAELAKKYRYPEYMVARFERFVPDLEKFLASMEAPPRTYIRVNTLRINANALTKRLTDKGFTLRETDIPDCLEVTAEPYSIGASAEYLLGYFYVQDKSSVIPPLALAPQPGDVVIDMAASPGGKTTQLAQMMDNKGLLIAIEVEIARIAGLRSNLGRCGVMNTALFHMDARDIKKLEVKADKILLDAPCTGEGVIAKDRTRKTSRGESDIQFCSGLQEELIDAAYACMKPGGVLVYSTCSFAPEENERIVDHLIKKYGMKVEPVPYGEPGIESFGDMKFDPQVKNARRLYPHLHGTSGFFVARLKNV
ncbi:NOL1/NOP2/sun family putative RNA methylase [Methanocella paludicola SANAE]|uniref:NOL1/NOP2/sun family putative RNA methylase n=1 Tax=Methanocella paludicola (strain DSM 17711 / JCM 13418 / NBRC 101707 / SANAE) TaxID=304371 RepID=D1YXE9_METPS|nr:NOL1/NOP2/sun family putative RNA methylase [Methanocella paludicola]BAI61121.1 NOL1/NOP2/sun family putative RNA methylase [Methanocella paludicola SANAE]